MKHLWKAFFVFFLCSTANAAQKKLVKVYLLEALAPRDTTSSESFRAEFNSSVELSKRLVAPSLLKCGYELDTKSYFFDASDQLQAFERAAEAEKDNAWLIVGPRRSNHYLLVAKGAPSTPSVSIMASSSAVAELGTLHRSVYPFNDKLARAAVRLLKAETKAVPSPTYFTVLSEDCVACGDFSSQFDELAKTQKVKKIGQLGIAGENPDAAPIVASIQRAKPDFVLLPNYSKVSALLMGAIHDAIPGVRFIGSDGWGDSKFGFVERNPAVRSAPGFTVRGFPPADIGLKRFKLGLRALQSKETKFVPSSGPGLAILRIFEGLERTLCASKPDSRASFSKAFQKPSNRYFDSPWGVSAYKVSQGSVQFWKTVP